MKRIAIIGAGLSGLVLARELSPHAEVVVYEKARGIGGRMSTRYADPFYFDHGTQDFTARTPEFRAFLKPYRSSGIVSEWVGQVIHLEIGKKESKYDWVEPHLVASPHMNSLCKALAQDREVVTSLEVAPIIEKHHSRWNLIDTKGLSLGSFDWVISTAPPAQTLRLFGNHLENDNPLYSIPMQGCYAVMLGFAKPWDKRWILAKVRNNPIKWISVNSSKPGRNAHVTSLVIHSQNDWAEAHIHDDMDVAQAFLLEQFNHVTGIEANKADYISCHRWRYAIVDKTEKSGFLINHALGLAATGDWCETSRIEEVWHHATQLAHYIATEIKHR